MSAQTAMLAASNLFLHLLGFAYRIVLSRLAGPEGMGVYTLVMQAYSILYAVALSGCCVAVSAMTAKLCSRGDIAGVRKLTRIALVAFFAVFALSALPIALFPQTVAVSLLGDARTQAALLPLLVCIFLTGIENVIKSVFHGSRQVKYAIMSETGEQCLRIALVLLLLFKLNNDDHGRTAFLIILGMTLSEIFSVSFLLVNYRRRFIKCEPKRNAAASMCTQDMKAEFKGILLPTTATSLISNMFSSVATILFPARLVAAGFERSAALSALGVISGMAAPLMTLSIPLINSMSTVILPNIASSVAVGDAGRTRYMIAKALMLTGILALPLNALLLPAVPRLCELLFGQGISATLALMLAVHAGISYFLIVSISILNGLGRQRQVLTNALIGESVQLALIWLLAAVPELNVYGYMAGLIIGDALRLTLNLICVASAVSLPKAAVCRA